MVNKSVNNIQDIFLNNARKNKNKLTVHLLNGSRINGIVKGFDNFTVILECEDNMVLIYKHSISTITPEKPVPFISDNM